MTSAMSPWSDLSALRRSYYEQYGLTAVACDLVGGFVTTAVGMHIVSIFIGGASRALRFMSTVAVCLLLSQVSYMSFYGHMMWLPSLVAWDFMRVTLWSWILDGCMGYLGGFKSDQHNDGADDSDSSSDSDNSSASDEDSDDNSSSDSNSSSSDEDVNNTRIVRKRRQYRRFSSNNASSSDSSSSSSPRSYSGSSCDDGSSSDVTPRRPHYSDSDSDRSSYSNPLNPDSSQASSQASSRAPSQVSSPVSDGSDCSSTASYGSYYSVSARTPTPYTSFTPSPLRNGSGWSPYATGHARRVEWSP